MTTLPRPPAVTMACVFVGISSLLLFGNIVSILSDWGSIELQEQVSSVLDDGRLSGLDLTLTEALRYLRWLLLAAVTVSIAGVVFAIYTARGHKASRIFLTLMCVVASVMFVTGGLIGLLPAAFAIACGFMLWSAEARQWFAVKNGDPLPPTPEPAPTPPPAPAYPAQSTSPLPPTPTVAAHPPARTTRPRALSVAAVVAVVASSVVAAVAALSVLTIVVLGDEYQRLLSEQDRVQTMARDSGLSIDQIAQLSLGIAIVLTLVGAAGIAAGALTLSGHPAGRTALLVASWVTIAISVLGFPIGLPFTAAAIVVLVQLFKPEAKAWKASEQVPGE